MTVLNRERAWQKIEAHDASGDGQFVYAVRTTGIYCRPSCPSRRPVPKNVVLYGTPEKARAAGYRACKRCRPDAMHPQAAMVAAACRYLDDARDKAPTLAELGAAVRMSPFALQRLFRSVLGVTPRQYFATRQTHRFRAELAGSSTVTSAVYQAGYGSSSRVYEGSDDALGMTPGTYRKQGVSEQIRYTLAASPLGRILVAATERGLCAVAFADTDQELIASLHRDFSRATLQRDDAALQTRLTSVLGELREHPISTALPLDVRATAFQRRVWDALRQIPRGQTRSYGELAKAIGQPTAVRAVARACGQNPVAVLVPCHRVIGKGGAVTGYRWGMERKRRLLALEQVRPPAAS
jgi:AraC family transcriptional regulator of adaptative response/methylated-DNA-[protein]-cysteine methyltransferase